MSNGDTRLLEQWIRSRDAEAFKSVCERYAGLAYHASYRILRDTAEAEDITQECFEGISTLKRAPSGHFGAWIHKVATYRAINRRRGNQRRAAREKAFSEAHPARVEASWDDIYEHVDVAIAELPSKLRRAVVGHFLENQTHEAIALSEGVTRAAVTQRIQRGIGKIRATLERRGIRVGPTVLGVLLETHLAEASSVPTSLLAALGKIALSGAATPTVGVAGFIGGFLTLKGVATTTAISAVIIVGTIFGYHALRTTRDVPAPPSPTADEWNPAPRVAGESVPGARSMAGTASDVVEAGSVTGRVFEAASGKGISNVDVTAWHDSDDEPHDSTSTRTGSDGSYAISGLAEGRYKVEVAPPVGYQPPVDADSRLVNAEPEIVLAGCDFALLPEVPLAGVVVDRVGNPVSGADVHIKSDTFGNPVGTRRTVQADAQGQFAFHNLVPSGTLSIQAATATACSALETVDVLEPGVEDLVLRLEEATSMEGRVVDPEGRPVAGIRLRMEHLTSERRWFISTPPTSDAQGRFAMAPLAPGAYKITLRRDSGLAGVGGGKSEKGTTVRLAAGEQKRGITLVYDRVHSISGRVVNQNGDPVESIELSARARSLGGATAISDAAGVFKIDDLPDGTYEVEAYRRGTRLAEPIDGVVAGTRDLLVTIADLTRVSGRVTSSATGETIREFEVAILDDAADTEAYAIAQGFIRSDSEDGRFSISTDKQGAALVSVRAEGYYPASQRISIPPEGGLDGVVLSLKESPILSGMVVDESDAPVPRARIFIGGKLPANRENPAASTGATGEFTLRTMPDGAFQLTAVADGYAPESIALTASSRPPVRIVLKSGGVLEGVVEFSDDQTLDVAAVTAEPVDGPGAQVEAKIAEDGSYRIEALGAGAYFVRVGVAYGETGYRALLRNVEIRNGRRTRLDLVVPAGAFSIEGRVHDGRADIKRAVVTLHIATEDGGEEEFAVLADESGLYRIEGLPTGAVTATATITTSDGADMQLERGPVNVGAESVVRLDFVD